MRGRGRGGRTDVEVSGGVAEGVFGFAEGGAVVGEDGAREGEAAAGLVDVLEDAGPVCVFVDVDGEDGAEDFVVEELVGGG